MPQETMTPRERWLAVLKRQKPDRIPMDYWATAEATEKLLKHLGCDFDTMIQKLHIDLPVRVGPQYAGPPPEEGKDIFGVSYQSVDYSTGHYAEAAGEPPLSRYTTVEEIESSYRWPAPDDWDYSAIPDQIHGQEHRPVLGGGSEPFLRYKLLRGEEQAFMDLLDNPEIVHYCLDRLFNLAYEDTRRIFEAIPGVVNITYIAEDLGGQSSLMYSPAQIREFFLPWMKKMCQLTRENGSYVFTHTDGAVRDIIPDLVGIGVQVLNPIQWRCKGMEREGLKRDFGDALVFHGAVDNQQTLPFGSVQDVRQEVLDNIRILGEGGGYIVAPCHNIQSVGPPENVVAMYATGYEEGWT